ncbi:hypothetical protein GALMADRAFT_615759 [Galerina marginata CBS 339.88]|uniref:Uncharacterized protein n=1 Tax=Galerina marginata (strain CBS 339.88) TaxID=685588 RepID=A0A067T3D7_GALM3|nr:hypothetical protein GALMADRAFT_615759 [Galerina marginata CBS 339.88]
MLVAEPKLRRYEDSWPLEAYFMSFSRHARSRVKQQREGSPGVEFVTPPNGLGAADGTDHDDNSQTHQCVSPNTPRTPCHGFFISTGLRMQRRSTLSQSTQVVSLPNSNSTSTQPHPASFHPSAPKVTISAPVHHPCSTNPVATEVPPIGNASTPIVSSCAFCEPSEMVDAFYNSRLREFLGDDTFLRTLASVGVCFDQHLDILLRFDSSRREQFFDGIPLEVMDALTKFRLLKHFGNDSTMDQKKKDVGKALWIPYIPRSPANVENELINADSLGFDSKFREAMYLTENSHDFPDLLETMRIRSNDYLHIYHPNTEQLREAIFTRVIPDYLGNMKISGPLESI